MIKIENARIYNIARAVYSARNAMNSWDKSDSDLENDILGSNDLALAMKLRNAGSDHRKFMRQIFVSVDITAPMYWWSEADTYKVSTARNSCSKMHTLHKRPLTLHDFSIEHLEPETKDVMMSVIATLNALRDYYCDFGNKSDWYQMIQLLPESYNQRSTLTLNYEVLLNMYHSRKAHKLNEWREFCEWIEELPYSELITGTRDENGKEKQGAALS
jgi:hypothetical protein